LLKSDKIERAIATLKEYLKLYQDQMRAKSKMETRSDDFSTNNALREKINSEIEEIQEEIQVLGSLKERLESWVMKALGYHNYQYLKKHPYFKG
jgi:predicted nuclease with TOPRIM domain